MEAFATSDDLTARYPTGFEDDEEAAGRANTLLGAASRIIRQEYPGIDARLGVNLDEDLVTDIVCEMVWSAINVSAVGATQQTQSVGSVSLSTTFEGAAGRLRLTKYQRALLRPPKVKSRASSVSNLPASSGDLRAPGAEWPYGCQPYSPY